MTGGRGFELYMCRYQMYFLVINQYCRDLFGANSQCISYYSPCHQLNHLSGHVLRLLFISLGSC